MCTIIAFEVFINTKNYITCITEKNLALKKPAFQSSGVNGGTADR